MKKEAVGKVTFGVRKKGSHAKRKGPKDKKTSPYKRQGRS